MIRTLGMIAGKVALAATVAGAVLLGGHTTATAQPVTAQMNCTEAPELMPAGECGGPIAGLTPSENAAEVCTQEAINQGWRALSIGSYDGILSTCAGVDEDSPIVDQILTAWGY